MTKFFNSKFFSGILQPVFTAVLLGMLTSFIYYGKTIISQPETNKTLLNNDKMLFENCENINKFCNEKNENTNKRIDQSQDEQRTTNIEILNALKDIKTEIANTNKKTDFIYLNSKDLKKYLDLFNKQTTQNK